jgi:hypothetical protein
LIQAWRRSEELILEFNIAACHWTRREVVSISSQSRRCLPASVGEPQSPQPLYVLAHGKRPDLNRFRRTDAFLELERLAPRPL